MVKTSLSKLTILFLLLIFFEACKTINEIAGEKYLLEKNIIIKNNEELINDPIRFLSLDKPNKRILGIPFKLHLHEMASEKPDSIFEEWLRRKSKRKKLLNKILSPKQVNEIKRYKSSFNKWLKKNGEAPVFIDSSTIAKNIERFKQYYKNKGFFNTHVEVKKRLLPNQKGIVQYLIQTDNQYTIESIREEINSPALDSLYNLSFKNRLIKKGDPFNINTFEAERNRLINYFRNNGVYNFQQNNIQFTAAIDSSGIDTKIPVLVEISNLQKRENDTLKKVQYQIHKVKEINLYIDSASKLTQNTVFTDSITYKDFKVFYKEKLKYKPKALEEVVFIEKNKPYSDYSRILTYRYISNLRNFKYPSIIFKPIGKTSDLEANIFLSPKERFSMGFDLDFSHSNIQDFGFSLGSSFEIRNIFRGAEVLEVSIKNTLGSSSDIASLESQLFNLYELGADTQLKFPRIIFPVNLEELIPKTMNPSTSINFNATLQQNIGLDKQYFGANYQFNWEPNKLAKLNFKIIDLEFINNQNISNYFNVYRNSYDRLNEIGKQVNSNPNHFDTNGNLIIPEGANNFIAEVLNNQTSLTKENNSYQDINLVKERQDRLTTNNLILGSSFGIYYNSQQNLLDETFFQFQWKLSLIGSLLNEILKSSRTEKNINGQYEIAGVTPSQFIKTEINYIKHWQLYQNTVLAFRAFSGVAIPFGNANSIPFSRSYFSGGSNDIRGWRAYKLGPGSSNNMNEFNEANFKLTLNLEYRFPFIGKMNGALFIDAGNIWNVLDNISDSAYRFEGFKDLNEIAIGTGFGIRYDFDFFVLRLDTGFKTYNPALPRESRWQTKYSIKEAVFNIGINYPF
ncbi:MAG: BamA/TamA family outer membrane protein [Bacteroidota bacterium]|nr:BamA/TamA family outer membrane protein [Bacteroidota bacterium]